MFSRAHGTWNGSNLQKIQHENKFIGKKYAWFISTTKRKFYISHKYWKFSISNKNIMNLGILKKTGGFQKYNLHKVNFSNSHTK